MGTPFVPGDFVVPQRIERERFVLRPLTIDDVENDYDAVMSSRGSLRHIFRENDDWPAEGMTLQDNHRDLERHQTDFEQRNGFTYTVETPDGRICLGCAYIYPSRKEGYDAQVHFWVRDSVKAQGLEDELGAFLRRWLNDVWPFRKPALPGRDVPWNVWDALNSASL